MPEPIDLDALEASTYRKTISDRAVHALIAELRATRSERDTLARGNDLMNRDVVYYREQMERAESAIARVEKVLDEYNALHVRYRAVPSVLLAGVRDALRGYHA